MSIPLAYVNSWDLSTIPDDVFGAEITRRVEKFRADNPIFDREHNNEICGACGCSYGYHLEGLICQMLQRGCARWEPPQPPREPINLPINLPILIMPTDTNKCWVLRRMDGSELDCHTLEQGLAALDEAGRAYVAVGGVVPTDSINPADSKA